MAYTQTHLLLCAVLLGIACSSAVWMRSVPNSIVAAVALTGLSAQAMASGVPGGVSGVLAALLMAALLTPFWAKHIMAAGDVKLGVAAATWVGLSRAPDYLLASALSSLVLATAWFLAADPPAEHGPVRGYVPFESQGRSGLASGGDGAIVPYGVAFAVGALFALQSVGLDR